MSLQGLGDPRNRPAIVVTIGAGLGLSLLLWLVAGWQPLVAWLVGWTPAAFGAYGVDKAQAGRDGWRIPEILLHGLALCGGVIGAWAGRLVFRHKTRKPAFLVVLIVASVIWGGVLAWSLLR